MTRAITGEENKGVVGVWPRKVYPVMNGRQLSDEARRRRSGLKVLLATGYVGNAVIHAGRLEPGVSLMTKMQTDVPDLHGSGQFHEDAAIFHRVRGVIFTEFPYSPTVGRSDRFAIRKRC